MRPPLPPALVLAALQLLPAAAHAGDHKSPLQEAREVIARFTEEDPGLAQVFEDAHGYAVFSTVGKGGLMYEASVGGQKFSFQPIADEDR